MDNGSDEYLPKAKRVRAPNFTNAEKEIFTDLLEKYWKFIECKKTDALTNSEKTKKWLEMCNDFNSRSAVYYRTVGNLQSLWENMKRDARKSAAKQRGENIKTGPRNASDNSSTIDRKVFNIMKRSGKCTFGGDTVDSNIEVYATPDIGTSGSQAEISNMSNMIEGASQTIKPLDGESTFRKSQEVYKWNAAVPLMLYHEEPDERVNRTESNRSTTPEEKSVPYIEPASSGQQQSFKINIEDEQEWARYSEKGQPSLEDDVNKQLAMAKINLTIATQRKLERESDREDTLFEIDKRKKELEVQIMELDKREKEINVQILEIQLLKMRKEMQENN